MQANLALLDRREPDLAAAVREAAPENRRIKSERGNRGELILTVTGGAGTGRLTLPDLSPPRLGARADEVATAPVIILLGFGTGRLLAETLDRAAPSALVVAIEPDVDLFARLLDRVDYTRLFADDRLSLAVGETPHDAVISRIERITGPFTRSTVTLVEDEGVTPMNADYFAQVKERIAHLERTGGQNRRTIEGQGALWRDNILTNLPLIAAAGPVSRLFGAAENRTAVLVAAGPSLARTLPSLAALKGRTPIIAVDTAVRPLLAAGIVPDFMVAIDANYWNYSHLDGLDLSEVVMILHPAVHPDLARIPCRARLFFGANDPLIHRIEDALGERGELLTGGTVAATAFDLARKMGCSPIVFTGQDLSYGACGFHTDGVVGPGAELFDREAVAAVDLFGRPVKTLDKMRQWRRWFELMIEKHRLIAVNATEGGVAIVGAPPVRLAEVDARQKNAPPVEPIVALAESAGGEAGKAEPILVAIRDEARRVKSDCGRGIAAVNAQPPLPLPDVGQRARQALTHEAFVELAKFSVDTLLDDVDELLRRAGRADGDPRADLTRDAYRLLFTRLYEIAAAYEKAAVAAESHYRQELSA
jgi:hypothetical protein